MGLNSLVMCAAMPLLVAIETNIYEAQMNDLRKTVNVGNPKPKKETIFCFVCIFEYIKLG